MLNPYILNILIWPSMFLLIEVIPSILRRKQSLTTYMIVRYNYSNEDKRVVKTGLTLEEARDHCQREDTHGDEWFDGYDQEK